LAAGSRTPAVEKQAKAGRLHALDTGHQPVSSAAIQHHFQKAGTMSNLRYWSFPVADAKAAVMMTTRSHTEVALVDMSALPHFLEQLERIRPLPEPAKGEKPAARRAAGRKRPT